MASKINDYDSMKNMLNITRQYKNKINEDVVPTLQPEELEDEKNRFAEALGNAVIEFGNFNRYNDNIEWTGVIVKEKITWVFSLDASIGCYISCEQIQLTDTVVKMFQDLHVYYNEWSQYWSQELSKGQM